VLALVAAALAAPLTCAEVGQMHAIRLPDEAIAAAVADAGLLRDDLGCVEALGFGEEITQAARDHLVDAPAPAPQPTESQAIGAGPIPPSFARVDAVRCDPVLLVAGLPDPGAAAALGWSFGFGAGHFYAGHLGAGAAFALLDVAAVGVLLGGVAGASEGRGAPAIRAGGVLLATSRSAQLVTAPVMASRSREEMLARCGY